MRWIVHFILLTFICWIALPALWTTGAWPSIDLYFSVNIFWMFISDRFLGKRRIHYVLSDRVCCQKLSLFSLPSVQYLHQIYLAALPNKRGKFIWLVYVELSTKPSEQAWFWHASAQYFHGENYSRHLWFLQQRKAGERK